jgi:O-antigen ligase
MPPAIAAVFCVILIAGLFWLDRDEQAKSSMANWIPVVWLCIVCSRSMGQWLHIGSPDESVDQVMDGSPVDRLVYASLLAIGLLVLLHRTKQVGKLLRANGPILIFFLYCALSFLWSDFPALAFKRWIKALGDLAMVMIVLTDQDPLAAFKRVLARLAYVLIPLSVLFIKYFPNLGMNYNFWTGSPVYTGVTTNKNTLGAICLCFGLAALWRFVTAYKNKELSGRTRQIIASSVILVMVLRLFQLMNSMTSLLCFLMAGFLILATNTRTVRRMPVVVHLLMAAILAASVSIVFLGISPGVLRAIGRNPTLTDRTELWTQLLNMVRNPFLGTGFESFWLGPRLEELWRLNTWRPNQAHNGYLEVYLNLGWVGIALLMLVLAAGYRTALRAWRNNDPAGSLRLAYFFVGIVFNFTEAAFFRMQAAEWLFFLFAIVSVPAVTYSPARSLTQSALPPRNRVALRRSRFAEEVVRN